MSLKNLINKTELTKIKIEYLGNTDYVYIKPIMAGDKASLNVAAMSLLNIKKKLDESSENDTELNLSDAEINKSASYRTRQLYFALCDKNGKREFNSYDQFMLNTPDGLVQILCEAVESHAVEETEEEVEKN